MAKQRSQVPRNSPTQARIEATHAVAAVKVDRYARVFTTAVLPKTRQVRKAGEVSVEAYFLAEMKASLRMVQAKTEYRQCLAEALREVFRKHNVPVFVEWGESR